MGSKKDEFKRGRTNLTDNLREGCPSTATTEDISAVRLMVKTDKRVTYQQIRTSLDIGMSQVLKILHENLAVRKLRRINWHREMMQRFAEVFKCCLRQSYR
ncbi:hypothetical protein EVAR_52740_1 [Eumeta japonica]|uniref:Uncharacterized protein n=1 Tax=Eumeta variegata TaxID=151549 RepID=A0A4C1Y6U0_EUMVA|nr:hypothetical protein EVAR_52740_1 [Eumeta japonica]